VPNTKVCVAIVTYNSSRYIRRCLKSVFRQDIPTEVVVVDNGSTDDTSEILQEFGRRIHLIRNECNLGFAAAQNRALGASDAEWVLTLNPDVLLGHAFIRTLVEAGAAYPAAGTVCGKLLSIGPGFEPLEQPLIDSTGIYFTPAMRHFDRGWHARAEECDGGPEYVFGASAAAALYRRRMIDDISIDGDFFDPDFFSYREDADVAWRALLLGWRCLYTPRATAHHVRTVVPGNRRAVSASINMHSVKNRFLMRLKNATPGLYQRFWLPMTLRDLVVITGSLFCEPASLAAFWRLAQCLPRALRQRRQIMSRRRISEDALAQWFGFEPVAMRLAPISEAPERAAPPAAEPLAEPTA
jgi:GT2 family glycosyltransferase